MKQEEHREAGVVLLLVPQWIHVHIPLSPWTVFHALLSLTATFRWLSLRRSKGFGLYWRPLQGCFVFSVCGLTVDTRLHVSLRSFLLILTFFYMKASSDFQVDSRLCVARKFVTKTFFFKKKGKIFRTKFKNSKNSAQKLKK